jgi:hypothetical protein
MASVRAAVWLLSVCAGSVLACTATPPDRDPAPTPSAKAGETTALVAAAPPAAVAPVHVNASGQLGPGNGWLLLDIDAPAGGKLTLDAPVLLSGTNAAGLEFTSSLSGPLKQHTLPLRLPVKVADGANGPATLDLSYFWCGETDEATCRREQARLVVALDLTGDAPGGEAHLNYQAHSDGG